MVGVSENKHSKYKFMTTMLWCKSVQKRVVHFASGKDNWRAQKPIRHTQSLSASRAEADSLQGAASAPWLQSKRAWYIPCIHKHTQTVWTVDNIYRWVLILKRDGCTDTCPRWRKQKMGSAKARCVARKVWAAKRFDWQAEQNFFEKREGYSILLQKESQVLQRNPEVFRPQQSPNSDSESVEEHESHDHAQYMEDV